MCRMSVVLIVIALLGSLLGIKAQLLQRNCTTLDIHHHNRTTSHCWRCCCLPSSSRNVMRNVCEGCRALSWLTRYSAHTSCSRTSVTMTPTNIVMALTTFARFSSHRIRLKSCLRRLLNCIAHTGSTCHSRFSVLLHCWHCSLYVYCTDLSRVSTLTRVIDIAILSVRPSVCLSVRYVPVLDENGLTYCYSFFSPYGSPIILVLPASNIFTKFRRGHPLQGR